MATIYMPLLDEGTDVWRPVEGTHLSGDFYRVEGPIPEGERWAFTPGAVIRCAWKTFRDGERRLTAMEMATS